MKCEYAREFTETIFHLILDLFHLLSFRFTTARPPFSILLSTSNNIHETQANTTRFGFVSPQSLKWQFFFLCNGLAKWCNVFVSVSVSVCPVCAFGLHKIALFYINFVLVCRINIKQEEITPNSIEKWSMGSIDAET